MNDMAYCNGLDCPLLGRCERYVDAQECFLAWWIEPRYDSEACSCVNFLEKNKKNI